MRRVNEILNVHICLFVKGHILSFIKHQRTYIVISKTYVCHLILLLCLYVILKKKCVYMSYKKKICVYMTFNIKRHMYTSEISWWFARLSLNQAISIRAPFLCAQRFLFASHSEKLAISIRAPLFVRSVVLLVSHSEKLAISLIFASHSEKLAISIRAPFFAKLSAASSIFNSSPVSNWAQLRHPDCSRTSDFSSLPAWERKRRWNTTLLMLWYLFREVEAGPKFPLLEVQGRLF